MASAVPKMDSTLFYRATGKPRPYIDSVWWYCRPQSPEFGEGSGVG